MEFMVISEHVKDAIKNGDLKRLKNIKRESDKLLFMDKNPIVYSAGLGKLEILKFLINTVYGYEPSHMEEYDIALMFAAKNGHLDVVKYLNKDVCADSSYNDDEPLYWANKNGHTEVIAYLESQGCKL